MKKYWPLSIVVFVTVLNATQEVKIKKDLIAGEIRRYYADATLNPDERDKELDEALIVQCDEDGPFYSMTFKEALDKEEFHLVLNEIKLNGYIQCSDSPNGHPVIAVGSGLTSHSADTPKQLRLKQELIRINKELDSIEKDKRNSIPDRVKAFVGSKQR